MKLTPRAQEGGSGNREGAWAYFCSGHVPSKDRCHFCGKEDSYRHLLVEENVDANYEGDYEKNGDHRVSCCKACTEWWHSAISMSMLVEADLG